MSGIKDGIKSVFGYNSKQQKALDEFNGASKIYGKPVAKKKKKKPVVSTDKNVSEPVDVPGSVFSPSKSVKEKRAKRRAAWVKANS